MSKTKVVRIVKHIYTRAMQEKKENHMDECSWLSYLILKGIEKIKEESE